MRLVVVEHLPGTVDDFLVALDFGHDLVLDFEGWEGNLAGFVNIVAIQSWYSCSTLETLQIQGAKHLVQIGVFEDVAEQLRHAGVLAHVLDRLGVQRQHLKTTQARGHGVRSAKAGVVTGKKSARAAQLFGLGVHAVHELVDQRNGDLLYLAFGVGHLPARC